MRLIRLIARATLVAAAAVTAGALIVRNSLRLTAVDPVSGALDKNFPEAAGAVRVRKGEHGRRKPA
jgi:hypothetical protein